MGQGYVERHFLSSPGICRGMQWCADDCSGPSRNAGIKGMDGRTDETAVRRSMAGKRSGCGWFRKWEPILGIRCSVPLDRSKSLLADLYTVHILKHARLARLELLRLG